MDKFFDNVEDVSLTIRVVNHCFCILVKHYFSRDIFFRKTICLLYLLYHPITYGMHWRNLWTIVLSRKFFARTPSMIQRLVRIWNEDLFLYSVIQKDNSTTHTHTHTHTYIYTNTHTHTHTLIYIYIYIREGYPGAIIIVMGNRHSDRRSNHRQGCLHLM